MSVEPARFDRRTILGGGALALLGVAAVRVPLAQSRDVAPSALELGYDRLRADLADAWWNPGSNTSGGMPAIRSTDGTGGWNTGRANFNDRPASVANARGGSFWQAAQYARFLANDRKLQEGGPRARAAAERVLAQRRYWRTIYTRDELAGNGSRDGTVNVSDDAAWKLQALKAMHEASRSPDDLAILRSATAAMLAYYVDTFTPAHVRKVGDLTFSIYGCLYARPEQDPNGQGRASTYETGIMDAALYLARQPGTGNAAFRRYAQTVYAGFRTTLQRPSGIYFQALQLDPARRFDGTPFLKPLEAAKAAPRQDYDGVTIGGTMGMAVVAAELFRQTGDTRYRSDVAHILAGIVAEYRQHGCLVCDRDPWTAGVWGYDVADRVLSLPGVDPGGKVAAALRATATRILTTRTRIDAYTGRPAFGYSAEWSGNIDRSIGETRTGANDGLVTWAESGARANGGRGGGQAAPNQIMTASSSGIIVQSAVALLKA